MTEEKIEYLTAMYERMRDPGENGVYSFPYEERFILARLFGSGEGGVLDEKLDEKVNAFVRENKKSFSKKQISSNRKINALPLYKDHNVTFAPPTEKDKQRLRGVTGNANI